MQMAILVSCPSGFPAAADITRLVGEILGVAATGKRREGSAGNWALELSLPSGEVTGVEFQPSQQRAFVEVDQSPTHFQWAIVEAMRRLGGAPNQLLPSFATKRLDEVKWWQRLQLRRRILGR